MKPEHRAIIAKAMSFLVANLDADSLLDEIRSQNILDDQSIEEIEKGQTFCEKAHRLCTLIVRTGDDAFDLLIKALYNGSQKHVAEKLLKIEKERRDHRWTGQVTSIGYESEPVQKAFCEVLKKLLPDISEQLRVNHRFLSYFVSADVMQIRHVDQIMQGLLDERVQKWYKIVDSYSHMRPSVLFLALENTSQDDVMRKIKNYWISDQEKLNQILYEAASNGNTRRIQKQVMRGADVNMIHVIKSKVWTPLIVATHNSHYKAAKLLIKHKAQIDKKNDDGETALHVAVFRGEKAIIQLLLESGSNVDAVDAKGFTALMVAAKNDRKDVVKLLSNHRAQKYL